MAIVLEGEVRNSIHGKNTLPIELPTIIKVKNLTNGWLLIDRNWNIPFRIYPSMPSGLIERGFIVLVIICRSYS